MLFFSSDLNTNSDENDAATAGTDFVTVSMVVTFASNETTIVVPIQTREDEDIEGTETFRVTISDPENDIDEEDSVIIVKILDDDCK